MTRTPIGRSCHACGSTSRETPFPGARKLRGTVDRCTDCTAELARQADAAPSPAPVQTRASYRAAYRHRLAAAQLDLVDLVVSPP